MSASATIHELVALVRSDVRGFTQGMRHAAGATRELRASWVQAGRDVASAADRVATAVGAAAFAVGAAATKIGISFNTMKRSAEIGFTTMLGDGQKAQAFLKELAEFAKSTPFNLRGLIENSQRMMAMGFSAEQVIPTLRAVGDAVAGLGGDPEKLNRIILALGQIRAKGRVQAQELLQLNEAGIEAQKAIADHLGVTIPEALKLIEQGSVDADTAITALTNAMNAKFGGMMVQMEKELVGKWQRIKEVAEQSLGEITKPLFDAMTRWASRLSDWMDGGEFQAFVLGARNRVADLTAQLEASWPVIRETVSSWLAFLRPIGEFIARHPEVVASFVAIKTAGVFGLTQALSSLGVALGQTVLLLGQGLIAAVRSAQAGLVALGVTAQGAWAAATLGVSLLVTAIVGAGVAAWTFRDEIMAAIGPLVEPFQGLWDIVKELAASLWELATGAVAALVAEWKSAFGPVLAEVGAIVRETLVPALRDAWSTLANELGPVLVDLGRFALPLIRTAFEAWADVVAWLVKTGLRTIASSIKTLAPAIGSTLKSSIVTVTTAFRLFVSVVEMAIDVLTRMWDVTKKMSPTLGLVAAAVGSIPAPGQTLPESAPVAAAPASAPEVHRELNPANFLGAKSGASQRAPAQSVDQDTQRAADRAVEEAAKQRAAIDARIESGRQAALDEATPGHSTFRDILGMQGLTGADAAALAAQQQGVNAGMASAFGRQFDAIGGANADPAQLDALATRMAAIVNEEQRLAQARQVSTEGVQGMADTLNGLRGSVPKAELDAFWQQALGLRQALLDGTIGAEEFSVSMQRLSAATDEASAAADRKAEREKREALLKGDFAGAGLDFRKALEDRIASFRMGQFNQAVEAAFQGLFPLADAGRQVTNGFRQMVPAIQQAGESFAGAMRPGGNLADAMARFNAWASTAQGRAVVIFNQIQIMQQGLEFASRENRKEIEETIAHLREQLDALLYAPQPFVGQSGDGFFRDPGFVDPDANRGGGSVMISFPNVTRVTNSEADMLAGKVAGSLGRRGRPI